MNFNDYADAMERGAALYPVHERSADLCVHQDNPAVCAVCADGALIAGLAPGWFHQQVVQARASVADYKFWLANPTDGDDGEPDLFNQVDFYWQHDVDAATGGPNPLLHNYLVFCPLVKQAEGGYFDVCAYSEDWRNCRPWGLQRSAATVRNQIVHLYDDHAWSIDQVVSWLRSLDGEVT